MNAGSVRSCSASALALTWPVLPELALPRVPAVSLPQGPLAVVRLLLAAEMTD